MQLIAVSLATLILLFLSIFQIALAAGAPFGRFAWGGEYSILPATQRIASVASVPIYSLAASFLLQKAGFVGLWPAGWIEPVIWTMACTLSVIAGLNSISRSRPERLVMTPLSGFLATLFFVVSRL